MEREITLMLVLPSQVRWSYASLTSMICLLSCTVTLKLCSDCILVSYDVLSTKPDNDSAMSRQTAIITN